MTRIIGGGFSGRRLATPPGGGTRPTSDRVREALFGSLEAFRDLTDSRWLDLYAGSGAVGLEAVSRGAEYALFVESHAKTARVLRQNIAALEVASRADVVVAGLPGWARSMSREPETLPSVIDAPFDVVYVDPPYSIDNTVVYELLEALLGAGALSPDVDVVVERSARGMDFAWPKGLTPGRSRRYGETVLWYGHGS